MIATNPLLSQLSILDRQYASLIEQRRQGVQTALGVEATVDVFSAGPLGVVDTLYTIVEVLPASSPSQPVRTQSSSPRAALDNFLARVEQGQANFALDQFNAWVEQEEAAGREADYAGMADQCDVMALAWGSSPDVTTQAAWVRGRLTIIAFGRFCREALAKIDRDYNDQQERDAIGA